MIKMRTVIEKWRPFLKFLIFRAVIILLQAADSQGGKKNRASYGEDPAADWQFGEDLNMGLFRSPGRSCWDSGTRPEALYLQ